MKFRRPAKAPKIDVDHTIAMIRAVESPSIQEMAGLLVCAGAGTSLDASLMDASCGRVADEAQKLGLPPDAVQEALAWHDTLPVQDGVSWFTIVAALQLEES